MPNLHDIFKVLFYLIEYQLNSLMINQLLTVISQLDIYYVDLTILKFV